LLFNGNSTLKSRTIIDYSTYYFYGRDGNIGTFRAHFGNTGLFIISWHMS